MSISLTPARAAASRRNGAKSQGPRTAEGKARSAKNALRHGMCAEEFVVLYDEDEQAFAALEAALLEELAPQGALQRILAGRIVRAAWRLERAERIEIELFEFRMGTDGDLALALIRDGNGTRSFDTLMRYRGSALAELFRCLRTLKALQAEARTIEVEASGHAVPQERNEPETRANPDDSGSRLADTAGLAPPRPERGDAGPGAPAASSSPGPRSTRCAQRNEPESRADAGPAPAPDRQGSARLPCRALVGSDARPARATKGRGNPGKTAHTPSQTNPRHRLEFMD